MKAIKGINESQIADLFDLFIEEYGDLYSEEAYEYIIDNFWTYLYSPMAPDILMQVYSEIGVEPVRGTFYNAHLKNIESLFGLDTNIIEVASGMIPSFAKKIAERQARLKKGTITIYDPLLLRTTSKYPNMTLHKDKFTRHTDIKDADLVAGILTCEATEEMIVAACNQRKNFYIAMCGCDHIAASSPIMMAYDPTRYSRYIIDLAKRLLKQNENGELQIKYLNKKYDCEYPILYNRKK